MLDCPICYPGCTSCLHELFESCPNCDLAQDEDWLQALTPAAHVDVNNTFPDQSAQSGDLSSLVPASNVQVTQTTQLNLSSRRREWTDPENREFERWITSNPKPTRLDKYEFASAHINLTFQQVQNKINNWRNGRNIQRQQSVPGGSTTLQGNSTGPAKLDKVEPEAASNAVESNNKVPLGDGDTSVSVANAEADITAMDFDEPTHLNNSPAPSILRYLESTELEADRDAIEHAVGRASSEALKSGGSALPPSHSNPGLSLDTMFGLRDKCNRCENKQLKCERGLPCRECQKANDPVIQCSYSYSLRPTATEDHSEYTVEFKAHKRSDTIGGILGRSNDIFRKKRATSPSPSKQSPPVSTSMYPAAHKASSVVVSRAGSAKSSRSGRSSVSVRYQQKLQRRSSANNRRFSTIPPSLTLRATNPPSHNASRRSLPSMAAKPQMPVHNQEAFAPDDSRSECLRCPTMTCTVVFRSRKELEKHEKSSHFICYCSFCQKDFSDHNAWRIHENTHFQHGDRSALLWRCGFCNSLGLSEQRRYIHLRNHWKEGGCDVRAWQGIPSIVPLSSVELNSLDWLTDKQFDAAANTLLKKVRSPPSREEIAKGLGAEPRVRLKDRMAYSEADDEGGPPTVMHGFFASIRRSIPGFRKRFK